MRQDSFFPFDNSYARLPERFFARLPPTPVPGPELIRLNESLALQLGHHTHHEPPLLPDGKPSSASTVSKGLLQALVASRIFSS
ncbi:MAG TPA: hypothetical protein EYN61_01785 [Chromatiaceae bacterium]|nr:hypothetical protein [Chromatiaceae bacterium]